MPDLVLAEYGGTATACQAMFRCWSLKDSYYVAIEERSGSGYVVLTLRQRCSENFNVVVKSKAST